MTEIRMEVTPTGRTLKGPGFIASMYSSGPGNFHNVMRLYTNRLATVHFADVEARLISTYFGHDPRNHFGKFATRRNIK